jgi:hypothetical protein
MAVIAVEIFMGSFSYLMSRMLPDFHGNCSRKILWIHSRLDKRPLFRLTIPADAATEFRIVSQSQRSGLFRPADRPFDRKHRGQNPRLAEKT